MNEQRSQDYLNLLDTLPGCPSGEEAEILNDNRDLIDSGLVEATYLNFLFQVLRAMAYSKGDSQLAYLLLQAKLELLDDYFAQVLRIWTTTTLAKLKPINAQRIARYIVIFSNWIQSYSLGSEAGNLEIAITGYEAATIILAQDEFKEEWAEIQNNLGVAYRQRIRGNRAENLDWAIKCFEKALEIRTKEDFPKDWAQTQNNLGNTYCDRIYGDPMENLERGIDAYKAALEVYTSHSQKFLQEWAMTQSNLGAAYQEQMRRSGKGEESLKASIAAYRAALRVHTRKTLPKQWATTINNLGNAYLYLGLAAKSENP
jgi:tetratricopeptide (TPR) repeat protein